MKKNDLTKQLEPEDYFIKNKKFPDFQVIRMLEEELPLEEDIYKLVSIMMEFPILNEYTRQLCILADCLDKVNHKYLKAIVEQMRMDALDKLYKRRRV